MRHHTLCFQAFSNHLLRGGASEGEKVWKPAGGFRACLDRVQRSFGLGVDESFITPIKNFPSRWEQMRKLEGGGQRWEGVREPERGREALPRQHSQMNSKNFIRTQMRKRFIPNTRECDENVIISFSRRFKTSTSDNYALTPLRRQNFLRIVFEKIICLLDRS